MTLLSIQNLSTAAQHNPNNTAAGQMSFEDLFLIPNPKIFTEIPMPSVVSSATPYVQGSYCDNFNSKVRAVMPTNATTISTSTMEPVSVDRDVSMFVDPNHLNRQTELNFLCYSDCLQATGTFISPLGPSTSLDHCENGTSSKYDHRDRGVQLYHLRTLPSQFKSLFRLRSHGDSQTR